MLLCRGMLDPPATGSADLAKGRLPHPGRTMRPPDQIRRISWRQIEECSVSADEAFGYLFTEVGPRTDIRPFARRERAENSRMELA
jgi:hypothetical protein